MSKIMNAEEIADELFDIMCDSNNVEEPAGRGCGYGFTEDGQAEILAVIKRILPQTEKDSIMKEQMHNVTIDKVEKTFNKATDSMDEACEGVIEGRFGGTTKLVSVLKAYEAVRKDILVEGDGKLKALNNLEVEVDGSPFPG